jgi:hypothetical protein
MCNEGEVRIHDGENCNQREGRVEMCYNGVWGTVCADGWDEIATNITCTQLMRNHSGFFIDHQLYMTFLLCLSLSVEGVTPGNFSSLSNNIACSENHSILLQCIDVHNFDIRFYDDCENGTAEVVCQIPNTDDSTNSIPTTRSVSLCIN